jgi:hypothetical protein
MIFLIKFCKLLRRATDDKIITKDFGPLVIQISVLAVFTYGARYTIEDPVTILSLRKISMKTFLSLSSRYSHFN